MKFYKTIMKAVVVAMAAMAVLSCQEKPGTGEGDPQLNEDLELTVDVEDITYTSAKIKVTHNGAKSDTWFGFLTEVVEGDEDELINQAPKLVMFNGATGTAFLSVSPDTANATKAEYAVSIYRK